MNNVGHFNRTLTAKVIIMSPHMIVVCNGVCRMLNNRALWDKVSSSFTAGPGGGCVYVHVMLTLDSVKCLK